MTSPRQRKKRLAILNARENASQQQVVEPKEVVVEPLSVVESTPVVKQKKTKTGLVELKSQDQVVEQQKEEVKSSTGE